MVEFAVVIPLFLLLLFVLIDFSRLLFTYASLVNGAREVARVAAIPGSSNASIMAAFNNYTFMLGPAQPSIDHIEIEVYDQTGIQRGSVTCDLPPNPAVCTAPSRASAGDGYVEVEVEYRFQFNPLFQATLAGVQYVGFTTPYIGLETEAKAYLE